MLILMTVFLVGSLVLPTTLSMKAVCQFEGEGKGEVIGEIQFESFDDERETEIYGSVFGLEAGLHGFHIHTEGDLSEDCSASGGHYNPTGNNHGSPGSEDRHIGDLGNIAADDLGMAVVRINDHLAHLTGEYSVLNRAIVIHSGTDDLGLGGESDSLTTGHAGSRAGCCVIYEVTEP